jgi:hypothetical protein
VALEALADTCRGAHTDILAAAVVGAREGGARIARKPLVASALAVVALAIAAAIVLARLLATVSAREASHAVANTELAGTS